MHPLHADEDELTYLTQPEWKVIQAKVSDTRRSVTAADRGSVPSRNKLKLKSTTIPSICRQCDFIRDERKFAREKKRERSSWLHQWNTIQQKLFSIWRDVRLVCLTKPWQATLELVNLHHVWVDLVMPQTFRPTQSMDGPQTHLTFFLRPD